MDVFSGQSSGKLDYLVSCPLPIDACASAFLGAVTTCTTIDLCGFLFSRMPIHCESATLSELLPRSFSYCGKDSDVCVKVNTVGPGL